MKYCFSLLLLCVCCKVVSQTRELDSLNNLIAKAKSDTARINLVNAKINPVGEINLDSAIALAGRNIKSSIAIHYLKGEAGARVKLANNLAYKAAYDSAKNNLFIAEGIYRSINDSAGFAIIYASYGVLLAMQNQYQPSIKWLKKSIIYDEKLHDAEGLKNSYMNLAISYQMLSDFGQALNYYQRSLQMAEQTGDLSSQAYTNLNIAITYGSTGDTVHAEQAFLKAIKQAQALKLNNVQAYAYSDIATLYSKMHKYHEAYNYATKAVEFSKAIGDVGMEASALSRAAVQLSMLNQHQQAEAMVKRAMIIADSSKQSFNIFQTCSDAGSVFENENKNKEAIAYYEKAFSVMQQADLYDEQIGQSYFDLSALYEKTGNYVKALAAYKKSSAIKDSLTSKQNIRKATELTLNYEFDKKQQALKIKQQQKDEVTKTKQTALIIGLILTVILAGVALNGYRNKQRANHLLKRQKNEIEVQRDQINKTFTELKITQVQLIQSEKMASLGELTAGIAHEIQNPLNFVNNFSEVNKELLQELKEEADKGNIDEVKAIANDVIGNEEKINHHGKRADSIVKNMLQHSRQTQGVKEPTDINALCDEYLRLSYHGLRAKDKEFIADFKTDFDESIKQINIVPQDIGRVLLNLFNNAFYAVNEKKKLMANDYHPLAEVKTRSINDKVEIVVRDNGNGIPQSIIDKIFQPFFTTKPTGQGTGLGLSLTYDIITKEHNGTIKVDSKEDEGTTFTILLPA